MRYINGTRLDDRIVRTDWDAGFVEGRQYGRGKSGGQVIFSLDFFIEKKTVIKWPVSLTAYLMIISSSPHCDT